MNELQQQNQRNREAQRGPGAQLQRDMARRFETWRHDPAAGREAARAMSDEARLKSQALRNLVRTR